MIGTLIHEKLITDFDALTFSGGGDLFNRVQKFYKTNSMGSGDCLVLPDLGTENVDGESAGNTATTREYGWRVIAVEEIEASANDSEGSIKYSRMMNRLDSLLDYIQKEPSNLNAWGNANSINVFKMRLRSWRYDQQRAENGIVALIDITFSVYLNIIPQLL